MFFDRGGGEDLACFQVPRSVRPHSVVSVRRTRRLADCVSRTDYCTYSTPSNHVDRNPPIRYQNEVTPELTGPKDLPGQN